MTAPGVYPAIFRSVEGERAVRERYLQLLDRWPVHHQRLRLRTREGETFVMASGPESAPPVLAFQGSGSNAAMWLGQIARMSEHLRDQTTEVVDFLRYRR